MKISFDDFTVEVESEDIDVSVKKGEDDKLLLTISRNSDKEKDKNYYYWHYWYPGHVYGGSNPSSPIYTPYTLPNYSGYNCPPGNITTSAPISTYAGQDPQVLKS